MFDLFLDSFGSKEFLDADAVLKLLIRLAVDLAAAAIVIRLIYVRKYRWNEQVFTFFTFNLVTFSLCLLLRKVPTELGFALGLFAVFGILRYRTEPIKIRDLTYLFIVIGIAILNAVANKNVSVAEILAMNVAIIAMAWILELRGSTLELQSAIIDYDSPRLLLPGNERALEADLYERTGLVVQKFEVSRIDLIRDTARITVFFRAGDRLPEVAEERRARAAK